MEFDRLMGYKNASLNGGYRESKAEEPHWSEKPTPYWDKVDKHTGKPRYPDVTSYRPAVSEEKTHKDDPIVMKVLEKVQSRSDAGMKKYGVSMARPDVTTVEWLRHAQEEALDLAVYLERCINDLETN